MSRTGVIWDDRVNGHRNLAGDHPENPMRTRSIVGHLIDCGVMDMCQRVPAREATDDELLLVHTKEHLDTVKMLKTDDYNLSREVCDDDVFSCEKTETAARTSIGGLIDLTKKVVNRELINGFACIRPPGHHSNPQVPSGFCIFSNVAVAARTIQRDMPDKVKKVLIFDWDVHHGNGTEWVFYNDPSVLTISVHGHGMGPTHSVNPAVKRSLAEDNDTTTDTDSQHTSLDNSNLDNDIKRHKMDPAPEDDEAMDFFNNLGYVCNDESCSSSNTEIPPKDRSDDKKNSLGVCNEVSPDYFYPGTGFGERTGTGKGVGYNINVPWPCDGFSDLEYLRVVNEIVLPVGKEFEPDLVIVSAGFDCALGDTLGSMGVTPSGFDKMTTAMSTLAGGRLVLALEGGYNTEVISLCSESCVRALLRHSNSPLPQTSLCHKDQVCIYSLHQVKCTKQFFKQTKNSVLRLSKK